MSSAETDQVNAIIRTVAKELGSARVKFGPMASPHEGWAVIKEELDELWECVRANGGRSPLAMDEARQVAAMAIRYIVDLEPR